MDCTILVKKEKKKSESTIENSERIFTECTLIYCRINARLVKTISGQLSFSVILNYYLKTRVILERFVCRFIALVRCMRWIIVKLWHLTRNLTILSYTASFSKTFNSISSADTKVINCSHDIYVANKRKFIIMTPLKTDIRHSKSFI